MSTKTVLEYFPDPDTYEEDGERDDKVFRGVRVREIFEYGLRHVVPMLIPDSQDRTKHKITIIV